MWLYENIQVDATERNECSSSVLAEVTCLLLANVYCNFVTALLFGVRIEI